MTVVILFHQSGFRTFKTFYCHYVCQYLSEAFPDLVSYNRFVELQSREELFARGLELITTLCRNMKRRLLPLADRMLLRKRPLIESVKDQLKNISQIEHSRHRSVKNFFVNLLAGLIAYTWQPTKPALHFQDQDSALIVVC